MESSTPKSVSAGGSSVVRGMGGALLPISLGSLALPISCIIERRKRSIEMKSD